jgi:hypothetical protein
VARIIHDSGSRVHGPFIEVNCAAVPDTLLEAELFGFEAGAFTDAKRAKPGLFEAASGGTLFLDEIDALPLPLQSKFLKAIEEKRLRRLGAVADHPVDVKLIAATRMGLSGRVAEGRFRMVSPQVGGVLEGWFELQPRELPVGVGNQDQVEAYTVMGLRPQRVPLAMRGGHPLSRFVGRERELAVLHAVLVQVERGRGQVVGIVGEPGIGKSRLLFEFQRRLTGQRITSLEGRCLSYGSTIPLRRSSGCCSEKASTSPCCSSSRISTGWTARARHFSQSSARA